MLKRQNRLSEAKAIYKKKFIMDANATKGLADPGRWFLFLKLFWNKDYMVDNGYPILCFCCLSSNHGIQV